MVGLVFRIWHLLSHICHNSGHNIKKEFDQEVGKSQSWRFQQQHVFSPVLPALSTDEKKNNLPADFDIDMENPETERAAVAIQSQFRKFQKKKQDTKS